MKKFTLLILAVFFAAVSWAQTTPTGTQNFRTARNSANVTGSALDMERPAMTVRNFCDVITTFPFIEGFEGASYPPVCWSTYGRAYQRVINRPASGTYSIYAPAESNFYTYGLATPQVAAAGGSILTFKMTTNSWYGSSIYYTTVRVKVSNTDNSQASFTTIKEFSTFNYSGIHSDKEILLATNMENVWYEAEVDLSAYAGQNIYIAFETYDHYGCDIWLDDIMISPPSNCTKPVITSVVPAGNSATVEFTEIGSALDWQYVFSTNITANPDLLTPVNVDINQFTIDGLNPSTQYYVWVRSVCGIGEYSLWVRGSFRTTCGAIYILPYTETFSTGFSFDCWKRYDGSAVSTSVPSINTSNYSAAVGNSPSGSAYLYFGATNNRTAVMPEFADDVNTMQFFFWSLREGSSPTSLSAGTIQVGYLNNINDASTFVPVETFDDLPGTWFAHEVVFTSVPAGIKNIALRTPNGSSSWSYWVDDIMVERIPDCVKPTITGVAVTENSATVSFTENGSAMDWQYLISTTSTMPNESGVFDVDTSPFYIDGLNPNTQYYVWVRSVCSFGEYSPWTALYGFRTNCTTETFPWYENFATNAFSTSHCWKQYSAYLARTLFDNPTPFVGASTTARWLHNTTTNGLPYNHVKINNYGTYNGWLITPVIDLSTATHPVLTFDVALTAYDNANAPSSASPDDKFIVIISADGGNTWLESNSYIWENTSGTTYNCIPKGVYSSIPRTGEDVFIDLSAYQGATVRIAFYAESTVGNADNDLHIGNIAVKEMPACPRPEITGVVATETSAEVTVTENGSASEWQYLLSTTSTMPNVSNAVDVNANPFTINGLTTNTQYYVWVRSVCGPGEYSPWTAMRGFRTACNLEPLPFMENFSTWGTGAANFNPCWTRYAGASAYNNYPYANALSSNNGLYFYVGGAGTISAAFLPLLNADGQTLVMEFDLAMPATGRMEVVTTTNPQSNPATWTVIDNVINDGTGTAITNYRPYERIINYQTGTYIGFKYYNTSTFYTAYVDNIVVKIVSCMKPTITDVLPTENSATVSFTENGDASDWQYLISTTATMPNESNAVDVGTNPFTIESLNENTQYYIWVRSVCGLGEYSGWTAMRAFRTACGTFEVTEATPFVEGFENGFGCWTKINANGNGYPWVIKQSELNPQYPEYDAHSGSYFVASPSRVGGTGVHADNYLITPKLSLPAISAGTAKLNYWVGEAWNVDDDETYSVLVSTTGTNTTDFTSIHTETLTTNAWQNREFSLAAYAGQNIYIAFRHFNSYDTEMLKIDDVKVFVEQTIVPPTVITKAATDVTHNSAQLNKSVTQGTKPVLTDGYEYRIVGATTWEPSTNGALSNLTPETDYQFRAFATTADSPPPYYGEILTFRTGNVGLTDVLAGKVTLYPNPAKQTVTLAIDGLNTAAQVVITDLTGRVVETYNYASSEKQLEMNVSTFADGTYLVRIITEKDNSIQKLVVKK